MLLNTQRNRLFEILVEKGLQPSDFKESKSDGTYRIDLRDKPTSIYFLIARSKKDGEDFYQITKRPGLRELPDNKNLIFHRAWDST
jgi:hypothetical protein